MRVLAGLLRGMHALLWLVAGGLMLALVGAIWLLATPSGARFALAQVESRVAGFTVASVEGSVWGGLDLQQLRFSSPDGLTLRLDKLRLRLDASALWHARPLALELSAQGVALRLPPNRPTAETSAPPLNLAALPIRVPLPLSLTARIHAATVTDAAEHILAQVPNGVLHAHANARQIQLVLMPPSELTLPSAAVSIAASGELALGVVEPHAVSGALQWRVDTPEGWLPGQLRLDGSLHTLSANLDTALLGNWLNGALPPVSMRAALVLPLATHPARVEVPSFSLDALGGCLIGSGQFDTTEAGSAHARGQAQWQGINPGVIAPALAGQLSGALSVQWQASTGGQIRLSKLNGSLAEVALHDLSLTGDWSAQTAELAITDGKVAQGDLRGNLSLGLRSAHPVSAKLSWLGANLAPTFAAQGIGAVARGDARVSVSGALGDFSPDKVALRVDFALEHGEIGLPQARLPAQAVLRGAWQQGVLALDTVEARWGSAKLNAQGRIGLGAAAQATDALNASLTVPNGSSLPLAALGLPAVSGALDAEVSMQGGLNRLTGRARVQGRGLGADGWQLGRLDLSAQIPSPEQGELRVKMDDLRQQGQERIKQMSLDVRGAVPGWIAGGRQQIKARVQAEAADLSLAADGRWQAAQWQGQLTALEVRRPLVDGHRLADWHLQKAVPLSLSAASQRVGSLCLRSQDEARVCLEGQYATDQGGQGRAALRANLPLSLAQPWWPAGLSLPGRLVLDGTAQLRAGVPTAAVSLELPASSLRWPSVLGSASVAYEPIRGTARWQNQQVSAELTTDTPGLLRLNGQGQWTMTGAEPIRARLALAIPKLDRFGFLLPMIANPSGQAELDVALSGTRTAPRLTGQAAFKDLAFALPDTGIRYQAGGVSAQIDPQGALRFAGQITAVAPPATGEDAALNTAALHFHGTGQLADLAHWQVQGALNGEAVPMLRLPMLSVDASPALTVVADAAGATVNGQIVLPRVVARVAALPAGVVAPTEDLVIEGQPPPPAKPAAYPLQGKIALRLGDAVHLSGMGFRSDLAGGLTLSLSPNQPISALGEVRLVKGRYSAYGQDLQINPGRLVFVGPLTDPGLAVRAERSVGSTTVGLNIAGTLLHPKTTVFSNPSLPESEALSLLITGRSLDSASMSDGSAIKDAAVGLGIAQGDNVLRDLGQRFGFSGLGLDTTGGLDGTRLSLGKQINDRLFVRYAVGVFTGVGELITRYRLSRLFSIELTTSPEASGGDLIYQIK